MPLLKCNDCGLEATSSEDLELFAKNKNSLIGRYSLCKKCSSERVIRSRFNLTKDDYTNLVKKGCMICGTKEEETKLFIDHCHKSGKVRGALCRGCNSLLGFAKDDPEVLRNAIKYLKLDKED